MPKGSEPALKWKDWTGPHYCDVCKRKLTLEQVGEHRTYRDKTGAISEQFLWCIDHRGGRE